MEYTGSAMTRRRLVEVALLVALAAALATWLWNEHPKQEALVPTPAGPPVFSIQGVRPGMTREEVEALLGSARTIGVTKGLETTAYGQYEHRDDPHRQDRWVIVDWNPAGRAARVRGSHLHRNGEEVLGRGWPADGEALEVIEDTDVHLESQDGRILYFLL